MTAPCAICGARLGRELLVITEPDRFERAVGISSTGYRRAWVECTGCGAASDILPDGGERLADIEKAYYEVDYQGSSLDGRFAKVMALPEEKSDNAQRVLRIVDALAGWGLHKQDADVRRALDIGSGLGVFPARFLEKAGGGWSMLALEPDPLAAAHLRALARFEAINDGFPPEKPLGVFDLITLNKVVEHVADPVAMLRQLPALLNPRSGIVYVEVPDKRTTALRPPGDNILGALHRHLYGVESLLRLVKNAGLYPLRVERIVEPSGKLSVFAFATTKDIAAAAAARD